MIIRIRKSTSALLQNSNTFRAKLGVKSPSRVHFGVGNNPITQMFLGKRSIAETFLDHYREFEGEKYYGTYGLGLAPEPILVLRDLDLAQHILGKCVNFCLRD